jgi:hypothetical protein
MREIVGDILDMEDGLIFQCVNTLGKMGAGLALQTKKRFPGVFGDYHNKCRLSPYRSLIGRSMRLLGHVLLFTQETTGRSGLHTSYDALNTALAHAKESVARDTYCYFPYGMGCGLGGGDWQKVYQLIQHHFPDGIIVRLPETKG